MASSEYMAKVLLYWKRWSHNIAYIYSGDITWGVSGADSLPLELIKHEAIDHFGHVSFSKLNQVSNSLE